METIPEQEKLRIHERTARMAKVGVRADLLSPDITAMSSTR